MGNGWEFILCGNVLLEFALESLRYNLLTATFWQIERWFHSAFLDARKQDAIDLVTGAFKVGYKCAV